ncbi:GxxExxY protein [Lewinella sp. IMCC34183]|uniref:GxxExxY protein n=1 Tax=Lewinella sp. IMCC34183 TaxID=2248762 RepID=UPI000E24F054|nr:GxxExxY protein [Lewinella sp. IMCC34183]
MELNDITYAIIGASYKVHAALGPGLLESVYETCLLHECREEGLKAKTQVEVPVVYNGLIMPVAYRMDLLVEEKVVVEIKSVESLRPLHQAQVLTYLRTAQLPVGLLINFNTTNLREGIKRFRR